MLAVKSSETSVNDSDTLRRHRAMYERRLRELARIEPPKEDADDMTARTDNGEKSRLDLIAN